MSRISMQAMNSPARAMDDVARARLAYEVAMNQFNWAETYAQIDATCYLLSATELRLSSALQRTRSWSECWKRQ